jgi:hypothetical protein
MRLPSSFSATVAIGIFMTASAYAADATDALGELKAGYALKQAGRCVEAIPHFLESARLEPKPKALLNLADCEGQTGDLLSARLHATRGRDLARQANDAELLGVADGQLATLEHRLPLLTIRLGPGAPRDAEVVLDGKAVSMSTPIALNPGAHHVVAKAAGHSDGSFDVSLVEGARAELEVKPGPSTSLPAPLAGQLAPATEQSSRATSTPGRQVLTYGAFGLGGAGIALGVIAGIVADNKHGALEKACTGNNCPSTAQGDLDSFHTMRTVSTVGYVIGLVGVAAGLVLWLTAPKGPRDATAHAWIGPTSSGLAGAF